ncbi:MAG: hypothetical protein H0W54_03110 [Rubrobacter sp.]|nr:hypothetical protein [Rubrobacter sp.]
MKRAGKPQIQAMMGHPIEYSVSLDSGGNFFEASDKRVERAVRIDVYAAFAGTVDLGAERFVEAGSLE